MVKKLLVLLTLFLATARGVHATDRIAGASATMAATVKNEASASASAAFNAKDYAAKKRAIIRVLEDSGSPMLQYADSFLKACMTYQIDCYLLPAIAGHESGFGRMVAPGSNNAFGWGGGYIMFKNWGEGIATVAEGLRTRYVTQGPITPDMIGRRYAASTTWSSKVSYYMARFDAAEESQLQSTDFALE
ncbi:glucosaminidase domain-containing protein [Candidatus Microgenomates bacterium]|nr:glucosaminidase domain-containing protein [Candidatus Microgenomates bacterium]